jgi:hypothetical protein
MAIVINRKEQIKAKLFAEGRTELMNSPEAAATRESINDQVELVKRDYQQKERESQIEASLLVLTA